MVQLVWKTPFIFVSLQHAGTTRTRLIGCYGMNTMNYELRLERCENLSVCGATETARESANAPCNAVRFSPVRSGHQKRLKQK